MKKVIILCVFICGFVFAKSQDLPGFSVETGGLTVIVPSSTFERQLDFIVFRSVNSPYNTEFDSLFFKGAISKLLEYDRSVDLVLLREWSKFFLADKVIFSEELDCFELVCKKFDLSPQKMIYSNNIEVWNIGKTKLYIHFKPKRVPNGYIKVSRQPWISGLFFLIKKIPHFFGI